MWDKCWEIQKGVKEMHDDFYQMYLEELQLLDTYQEDEEAFLLTSLKEGKSEARQRLIEGNLKNALDIAKEYGGQGLSMSDLVQEANMALTMAVDMFESGDFSLFIREQIHKALEAAVEEEALEDQVGEELAARVNVLNTVSEMLVKELGREATVSELAGKMKMTEEEVRDIMKLALDAMSVHEE